MHRILCGDALTLLRQEPSESIDCCVTSPPYYRARDYHVPGQIGMEDTLDEYLCHLTDVFAEVHRVLKPRGTFWLNVGDAYAQGDAERAKGVRKKSLYGVPWRLALRLVDAGWIMRNVVVWHKSNSIPHPVQDRLTCSWEPVFLFTKSEHYFFDLDEIREPLNTRLPGFTDAAIARGRPRWNEVDATTEHPSQEYGQVAAKRTYAISARKEARGYAGNPLGKNPGDVWSLSPASGRETTDDNIEDHHAVFPEALVARCLRAGCPAAVCARCGEPPLRTRGGWRWCGCEAGRRIGIVLDPFLGSGTTSAVAARLQLDSVGIELNPGYCDAARRRVDLAAAPQLPLFTRDGAKPRPTGLGAIG